MYCCNFQYDLIKNMEYKLNRKNNRVHIDYLSKHELICRISKFQFYSDSNQNCFEKNEEKKQAVINSLGSK